MKNIKRIAAIICVIILVGLYVITFVMSIIDNSLGQKMFMGCLLTTIFLPIALYAGIALHKYAMTRSKRKDYYNSDTDK